VRNPLDDPVVDGNPLVDGVANTSVNRVGNPLDDRVADRNPLDHRVANAVGHHRVVNNPPARGGGGGLKLWNRRRGVAVQFRDAEDWERRDREIQRRHHDSRWRGVE
jgi:hypothetical protein